MPVHPWLHGQHSHVSPVFSSDLLVDSKTARLIRVCVGGVPSIGGSLGSALMCIPRMSKYSHSLYEDRRSFKSGFVAEYPLCFLSITSKDEQLLYTYIFNVEKLTTQDSQNNFVSHEESK